MADLVCRITKKIGIQAKIGFLGKIVTPDEKAEPIMLAIGLAGLIGPITEVLIAELDEAIAAAAAVAEISEEEI